MMDDDRAWDALVAAVRAAVAAAEATQTARRAAERLAERLAGNEFVAADPYGVDAREALPGLRARVAEANSALWRARDAEREAHAAVHAAAARVGERCSDPLCILRGIPE